jgi:hypothetical protein
MSVIILAQEPSNRLREFAIPATSMLSGTTIPIGCTQAKEFAHKCVMHEKSAHPPHYTYKYKNVQEV